MCINWIYIIRWFSCLNLRVYHFCGKKEHAVFTYMYRCQKGTKLVSYSLLFCTFCMNCGTLYINFFCKIIRYVYSSKTLIQKYPCIFLCNPANCMTGTGKKQKMERNMQIMYLQAIQKLSQYLHKDVIFLWNFSYMRKLLL